MTSGSDFSAACKRVQARFGHFVEQGFRGFGQAQFKLLFLWVISQLACRHIALHPKHRSEPQRLAQNLGLLLAALLVQQFVEIGANRLPSRLLR